MTPSSQEMESPGIPGRFTFDRDELVGTIVVEPPNLRHSCPHFARPGVASAHQFAVTPVRQGGGIGSRLLNRAESWAAENGWSELVLDTAEPAHHLIALYEKRGYVHIGFVRWDGKRYRSVVMSKKVGDAAMDTPSR